MADVKFYNIVAYMAVVIDNNISLLSKTGFDATSSGSDVLISTGGSNDFLRINYTSISVPSGASAAAVATAINVLRDTYTFGGGSEPSDGDKGDVTVTGSGLTWTIDNGAISLSKMSDMATASLIYRRTAGTGVPEVNTLAQLKTDLTLVKADVGLSNVVNADTTTTANITDSTNKRFVTDADLTDIGNLSGTNTGDQVISDATITTTDITTNNASASKHGFLPKLDNTTTKYLRDDGTWQTVVATAPDIALTLIAPAVDETITAGYSAYCSGYYEIADGKYLEIGDGSVFEIG